MKLFYPFLVAIQGIVPSATGQNHPKDHDSSLTVLSISDTPINISRNIEGKEAL